MRSDICCSPQLWRVCFWLASVGLGSITQAQPKLTVDRLTATSVQLSWPGADTGFQLEASSQLGALATWQAVTPAPALNAGRLTVTVQPAGSARFFRLRSSAAVLTSILETSPASGEAGVAVTRETILRFSAPLASTSTLTQERYYAEFGGRRILSRVELSGDRRTATLFYLENLPASARVVVRFDGNGLKDTTGAELDVDGDGLAGGVLQLAFTTSGVTGLPNTAVFGRVFASEKNADGSNKPLENVTVTVDGAEETLRATTDATGSFKLQPAPAGRFFVHVDGRTAIGSQWPGGAYYPFVGKAWDAIPGRTNNLAGGTGEIFLPLIQSDALQNVSATEETKVTFSPSVLAANPALAGVEVNVPANALFSDNGVRGGMVGIAPVPPDRLPEPLPPGLNMPLVITIQTDGGSNFDVPVPVKFPNLPDPATGIKLPPGSKTALWSFNHDTGRWEVQGTMTISADGNFAVTDPGVGIRQPGWHGAAAGSQGSTSSGPPLPRCQSCPRCDGDQELKMWFQIVDLGTDVALLPLNMTPGVGCATGFALSGLRTARDCTFLDVDECPTSGRNNLVNGALGCIPVFGALLGTTFSAAQTAQEIDKYYDNCAGAAAAFSRALSLRPANLDASSFLQDLKDAQNLLLLQDQLNQALANLNALILGSPAWKPVEWRTPGREYIQLLQALRAAVSSSSPLAEAISPEERTAILVMPRPAGIAPADVEALVNRFANTVPDGLDIPATPANFAVFDGAMNLLDQVYAEGWRNPHDGAIQAIIILSRLLEPLPPGTLVLSTGGGDGAGPRVFPKGSHHYLLVNLESGFATRGRTSPQGTLQNLILAPNTRYSISYYTTESSVLGGPSSSEPRLGLAMFTSQAAGALTKIPYAVMVKDEFPDSDGDGISDNAEVILGTGAYRADSDGDGIKDGQEVFTGTNPLDGVGLPKGIVGAGLTPGPAVDVAAGNNLAVVAANGLVVFDVTNPENPVQTAVVPGQTRAVALRGSLALAAFKENLRLFDLTLPAVPATLWSRADLADAEAVEFGRNSVFIVKGTTLHRLDLATGITTGTVKLPMTGTSILARGDMVYVLGSTTLAACRDDDLLGLTAVVSAGINDSLRPRLALGGQFLYGSRRNGVTVFDLSDPARPVLVRSHSPGQAGWRQLVPVNAGLALAAVGPNSTPDGLRHASLYNLNPGGTNLQFMATFVTKGSAEALAVAGARAFVAELTSGLSVVHYLDPDLAGIPPSITIDLDSLSVTPQVQGNSLVRLGARADDDIAVRQVEFFINGTLETRDDSYPYEVFYRTPTVSPSTKSFTLRLRAEDTAGNVTETPDITVAIVPDATPPKITGLDPAPGSTIPPNAIQEIGVSFDEPIVTPVSATTLSLIADGLDGKLGTADDVVVPGVSQYDGANKSMVFTANAPLPAGQYRTTLAANLADAAGNGRPRPVVWDFKTGPEPMAIGLFPPSNYVRVGGTLDELVFTFDQPLPEILAANYVFSVARRDGVGPFVAINPITVRLNADRRTFTLRTTGSFPPGSYQVTGSGPNLQPMFWPFTFRDVPNEAVSASASATNWKYPPGPGVGDELIINLPGRTAPVETRDILSLLAHTDIRFARQTINVPEPIQALAGLEISDTTFGPGVTHVYGPIKFFSQFGDVFTVVGPHTINAYGGGYIRDAELRFSDPNGALVNHPGSLLVLSNATAVINTGINWSNAGRIVNLGTLQSVGADVRLEDVRVRNDGRVEVATGLLKMNSLDNEGVINIGAGAKILLPLRARGGVSSRITGAGAMEFGEYNSGTRRVVASADAELKGVVDPEVLLKLVAGELTLWKPLLQQPTGTLALQNGSTLRLLSTSRLGAVALLDNSTLSFNADSQIASLAPGSSGTLEAATVTRITGDVTTSGLNVHGQGVVLFEGLTVLSNGTQSASLGIGHATLRNLGTWRQSANGAASSEFSRRRVEGQAGRGAFENLGRFEQTTDRALVINVPFRNAGFVSLRRGPVAFDARTITDNAGAYLPRPGSELVLNNTDFQHHFAGTLDLAAGILRGTGNIGAVDGNTRPRVINRAVLRPGNPTGDLTIRATGGFEQTATGELAVTLASNGNSRLALNGTTAALAGTLRVELAEGFSPAAGQTFTVLSFSSRTGEFENVILPNVGAGKKLEVVYSASAVTVRVVVP